MELSKENVRKYINDIFADKGLKPNPVETIQSICNDEYDFTFGNAQKLVNMTAKYMFISTFMDQDSRWRFEDCDCPMDSIILGVVRRLKPDVSWKSDYSWSKMTSENGSVPEVYKEFQDVVKELAKKENLMPIEFDFMYWDE